MSYIFVWIFLFNQATTSPALAQHLEQKVTVDNVYFLPENIPADSLKNKSVRTRFQPLLQNQTLKGGSWISFKVPNPTSTEIPMILEIETTVYFDLIELFVEENGVIRSLGITGDPVHHSLRPIKDHGLLFPIMLPPASTTTYFMYALSPLEYQLPLSIQPLQSFEKRRNANNLFYTFYYGFIAFVLTFSIFLSVIFYTERIYLFYSLYLISLLLLFLHINGLGFEYLWPDWPEFDKRMPFVASNCSMIFLLRFTGHFLRPNQLKPLERKTLDFFFYVYCLSLLLSQFIFSDPLIRKIYTFVFISIVNLSFFVTAWLIAFRMYKTGYKPALFYNIAFLFFFTSVSLYSARAMFSMNGWFVQHLIQLGNMIEVMVLTLGLAFWFKANQDEKQNLLERVSRQQKDMADEKDRIMRDLHDSLGGQLSSISIGLSRVDKGVNTELIQWAQEMTDRAIHELRDSIWVMNKESVSIAEIEQRINGLFWQYRKIETPIDLQLKIQDSLANYTLTSYRAGDLYRIIQEATHNSIKHSRANRLQIVIEKQNNHILITISDDGIGFETPELLGGEHYGLQNMRKRADQLEASFEIISEIGKGTMIHLRAPLK